MSAQLSFLQLKRLFITLSLVGLLSSSYGTTITDFGTDTGKLEWADRTQNNYGFSSRVETSDSFEANVTGFAQTNWNLPDPVDASSHGLLDMTINGTLSLATGSSQPFRIWLYDGSGGVAMHQITTGFVGSYSISQGDWSLGSTDAFGASGTGSFDWSDVVKVGFRAQFNATGGHSVTFEIDDITLPDPQIPSYIPTTELPAQVITLQPKEDIYVESTGASVTTGGNLLVRSEGTEREAYLKFDLEDLSGGTIERAELIFWATANDSQSATYNVEQVDDTDDGWDGPNVTWAGKPASLPATNLTFSGPISSGDRNILDVTSMITDTIANDASKELGIRLYATGSMQTSASFFGSTRNSSTQKYPYLHIVRRPATSSPIKLMHVGDSITRGANGGIWSNTYKNGGHRQFLHNLLLAQGVDFVAIGPRPSDGSISAYFDLDNFIVGASLLDRPMAFPANAGYSGEDIQHMRDNIASWIATYDPDYVTIMIGTNNIDPNNNTYAVGTALSATDMLLNKNAYEAMLNNLFGASPTVKVVIAKIVPFGGSLAGNNAARVEPFNSAVVQTLYDQFYVSHPGRIFLVDNYTPLSISDISSDDVHPTSEGHQKVAVSWHGGLNEAMGLSHEARLSNNGGDLAAIVGGTNSTSNFGSATTPLSPPWQNALLRIKSDASADNRAKSLLKFDVSGLSSKVDTALIGFTYHGNTPGGGYEIFEDVVLDLYGIADGTDSWTEGTVTWDNAPGNDTGSNLPAGSGVTYLDSVTIPAGSRTGDLFRFSSEALADFLTWQAGIDDLASFIIVANDSSTSEQAVLHGNSDDNYQSPFLILTANTADDFDSYGRYYFENANDRLSTANPDNGQFSNLIEYALGGDPTDASDDSDLAPDLAIDDTTTPGQKYLTLSFTPKKDDVTYTVKGLDTLSDASPDNTIVTPTVGSPYTYTDTVEMSTQDSRFLQLDITQP